MAFKWEGRPARILDACAAPGGKTAALALRFPDARRIALEREAPRARRLRENLAAWGLAAEVVEAEAGAWLEATPEPFDLILLDAPCTGSGTLAKHPELAWLGDRLDRRRLASQQRRLLEAALARLAPGGLLVYAVCSWLPEEGEAHRLALAGRPEFEPAAVWPDGDRFRPDPLLWEGEGFQGFALRRT